MSTELMVRNNLLIQAPPSRVWEVLVTPRYIKQWDDLPEDFNQEAPLQLGTEMVWVHPNGSRTTLTVISLKPEKELSLSLSNSNWTVKPRPEEVAYTYTLSEQEGGTGLTLTIGDFSKIAHGEPYYEASLDFAKEGGKKIKALAEGKSLGQ
jgi:uncharacterized protein YndB with AHSA1/START domain